MIVLDSHMVEAARSGDRAALQNVLESSSGPIFALAMRMLANRADAEDATQEILIKILTNLGSLQQVEVAGAWTFRVACRHLANRAKAGRVESLRLDFQGFAQDLESGWDTTPPLDLTETEREVALQEVRVGCTLAMLSCLSRPLRLAYILGEIMEMNDQEAATALEIKPGTFRQRLRRARDAVSHFMETHCSLFSSEAACRCEARLGSALVQGRASTTGKILKLSADGPSLEDLRKHINRLEQTRRAAAIHRNIRRITIDTKGLLAFLQPLL